MAINKASLLHYNEPLGEDHTIVLHKQFNNNAELRAFTLNLACGLGKRLLSNRDASGNPLQQLSPVRYNVDGDTANIHVLAWGTQLIVAILLDIFDGEVDFEHQVENTFISMSDKTHNYRGSMMIKNRISDIGKAKDIIEKCIERQAGLLGLDKGMIEITDFSCYPCKNKGHSVINKFRDHYLLDFEFKTNVILHGHWAAGSLINHGYGYLEKV